MYASFMQTELHSPELLGSVLVLLIAFSLRLFIPARSKKLESSPVLGAPGDSDFHAALNEGYQKVYFSKYLFNRNLRT